MDKETEVLIDVVNELGGKAFAVMSQSEIDEQRVSFIYGQLKNGSPTTKDDIRKQLGIKQPGTTT